MRIIFDFDYTLFNAKKLGEAIEGKTAGETRKILEKCDVFLYEDTVPFLDKISKNHKLALVTYGEDSFQSAKVDGCGAIKKYFDKIAITQNICKDKEVAELAQGERAMFIEDNPIALAAAKKLVPNLITVRMNRGDGRYANEVSQGEIDYEIKGLFELYETCLAN